MQPKLDHDIEARRELGMSIIADHKLKGYTAAQIQPILAQQGIDWSVRHINRTFNQTMERWRQETNTEVTERYEQMLATDLKRLEAAEQEAWANYRSALAANEITTQEVEEILEENADLSVARRVRTEKPGLDTALKWFRVILDIQRERRKIVGLYAPEKLQIEKTDTKVKMYVGLALESWPSSPSEKLAEENVIEGQWST